MSRKNDFSRVLDNLYEDRTHWLRNTAIGDKTPGRPPKFDREKVNKGIEKLQNLASDAFAKNLAVNTFSKYAPKKKAWHVKGHGSRKKKERFKNWFNKIIDEPSCVYIFWKGKKCLYVGRTEKGGSRPESHFNEIKCTGTTRVDVYPVKASSQLPRLECLAIHRFLPVKNKSKASTEKWTKKCDICKIHKQISSQLRIIFSLKKRKPKKHQKRR